MMTEDDSETVLDDADAPADPSSHSFGEYVWALLGATRPHFFALPIGAAFAGVGATGVHLPASTLLLVALICGGGWATGQLLNDILDREADAVDAPERAAVRGLLPPKTTISIALGFGACLLVLLTRLTPHGWQLGLLSMALILSYNWCKALPALGNFSHGALIACASLIGAAIARPLAAPLTIVGEALPRAFLVAAWAALYLQGNYEKDVRGDAAAGYRTLAHVLGLRGSALLRMSGSLALGVLIVREIPHPAHSLAAGCAAALVAASACWVAQQNTLRAALRAYRFTVHGAVLGMLAMGGPAVPPWAYAAMIGVAVSLTELAFRRTANP